MKIKPGLIEWVKGFLDPEEGERLYEIGLEASRVGPCLEIGSYCGKSTLYLGSACRENGGVLYSVDHHRGSEEQQPGELYFDPELYDPQFGRINSFRYFSYILEKAELLDTVVPIVASSALASRGWGASLSLLFIDGGHSYDAVFTDYSAWVGHIRPGGYLLIHDIFKNPADGGQAPYQIYKMALNSGLFKRLPTVKTLGVLQRRVGGELPDDGTG